MTQKKQEPSSYADASYMDDPSSEGGGQEVGSDFGCAGCHEIAGFEDEGRIGTELTFEGSKPIERLDFALFTEARSAAGRRRADQDKEDLARLPTARRPSPGTTTKDFSNTSLPSRTSTTRAW